MGTMNLAAMIIAWIGFGGGQEVSVELFSRNEKVIPLCYEHGEYRCIHAKPPQIVIRNHSRSALTVKKADVIGRAGGREVARFIVHEDTIEKLMAEGNRLINRYLADPGDTGRITRLKRIHGEPAVMSADYCESHKLPRSGHAALDLKEGMYFLYEGKEKVDALEIVILVEGGGGTSSASLVVPLVSYTCRGDYIYPVKGRSMVGSVPFGHNHRFGNAQEFAIDILDIRRLDDGRFSTSSVPNTQVITASDDAADYFIFNREVLAIGDGVILETAALFPDDLASNPQDHFMPRIKRIRPKLLRDGASEANITGGNFVVIDHGNGEFSRYCHLREEILVKKGDRVKRGDVIGYVGNSGYSGEPHLHLELLDSGDFRGANGLPIVFSDLDLVHALDSPAFGEKNSLLFSEFIFVFRD